MCIESKGTIETYFECTLLMLQSHLYIDIAMDLSNNDDQPLSFDHKNMY